MVHTKQTLNQFNRIYFLTDLTQASQTLLTNLKHCFATPVIFSTYDRTLKFEETDLIFLEVDSQNIPSAKQVLDELQIRLNDGQVALFTQSDTSELADLIKRFIVKGVFTHEMGCELIRQGVEKIDDGTFWFSREQYEIIAKMRKGSDLNQLSREFELTIREKQILYYLLNGYSINQMAEKLFIAENTIKTHRNRLYKKLSVRSAIEAIHLVHERTSSSVI